MSGSYERVFQKCAECGAQCGPTAERCWMCNARLSGGSTKIGRARAEPPPTIGSQSESSVERAPSAPEAMLLLVCALIIIGAGLWMFAPGLAILYCVVVVPALLAMLASRMRGVPVADSEKATLGEQLLILFSKFLKTVAVLILVIFGIVIAAGVFCFVLIESGSIRF